MSRGVLWIVWGDQQEALLNRSVLSVQRHHPELELLVERVSGKDGLLQKAQMDRFSTFTTTLFLDADTVVLGNLDYAFTMAETHGLACCINECPWLRRYGRKSDHVEYNTGALFWSDCDKAREVFARWAELTKEIPATSRWMEKGRMRGLACDDQASFAEAVIRQDVNPFVLPLNYNFRPAFHRTFFAPLKIWHSPWAVPPKLIEANNLCEVGQRPVTHFELEEFA